MSGNGSRMNEMVAADEYTETIRRREAAKRRKLKRKKERIKAIFSLVKFVLFFAIIIAGFFWITQYPHKDISNNVIIRNFTNKMVFIPKLSVDNHIYAWDSELPNFVKKDLKQAKAKDYTIKYIVGSSSISIEFSDGKPIAEINSQNTWALPSFNTLSNFSIYKKGNDLYVYGYDEEYRDSFTQYILFSDYEKYPDYNTLTYDTHLPFSLKDLSIGTVNFGEYSLLYDKENTFYFYKDGKIVSSKKFSDPISKVDLYDGLLTTTNNMLYMIYAYVREGIPELKFVYVADGVSFAESKSSSFPPSLKSSETNDYLPVLSKNNEYYTLIPNNWEDYTNYCIAEPKLKTYSRDIDYSASLVKLEDAFVSAKFENPYYEWSIEISFNINGKIYTSDDYLLYGYDSKIELSDTDIQKLAITVRSIDEFKSHIQTIRETYPKYYTIP